MSTRKARGSTRNSTGVSSTSGSTSTAASSLPAAASTANRAPTLSGGSAPGEYRRELARMSRGVAGALHGGAPAARRRRATRCSGRDARLRVRRRCVARCRCRRRVALRSDRRERAPDRARNGSASRTGCRRTPHRARARPRRPGRASRRLRPCRERRPSRPVQAPRRPPLPAGPGSGRLGPAPRWRAHRSSASPCRNAD